MLPTIRPATLADLVPLGRLIEQYWAFESIPNYHPDRIEKLLSAALSTPDRAACWVAEQKFVLKGYLFAVFVFSLEHGGIMAEVDEFFVVSEARGNGIGRELLRHAERSMQARDIVRIQLQLGVDNKAARRFYETSGYNQRSGYGLWDKPASHT